jgi:hypothetical protein
LRSEVGYAESPPGSNRTKFGAWYGWDGVPWCAIFVSWGLYTAFRANGEHSPVENVQGPKGFASVSAVIAWAKQGGRWAVDPEYGSLAIYDWDGGHGTADHIGWVSAVNGSDPAEFTAIEGNTALGADSNGGRVMVRQRRNDRGYCLGFVRIPYARTGVGPAQVVNGVSMSAPPWPGRLLALTTPLTSGVDVSTWQQRMRDRGWRRATVGGVIRPFAVDGVYGPVSTALCRAFQAEKRLTVDGVVGPATWRAAWTAPVT